MTSFQGFGLAEPIARALVDENYVTPTPIQAQTIPLALQGRDVIGIAQTGTGKTAAFALPILDRLHTDPKPTIRKSCRVLVLSPTRELSGQILDSFRAYGRHMKVASDLAIGGVSMGRQVRAVLPGLDVMVATPGRLLDLVNSNALRLNAVEVLVLDEADRMLDMGFIHDIRKIVSKLPKDRQTLFFSATMPQQIAELAAQMLRDPARVSVTPAASTAERIDQRIVHVDKAAKPQILAEVLASEPIDRCLVFTRTKHGADKVVRGLDKAGIAAAAIHGNKSQNQRERVLAAFRTGEVRILIATDIAARGIDVEGVSHVVNYDLPNIPESYVHRIGRTARAGAEGIAISFCDSEELPFLRDIEKLIRFAIPATDRRTGGRPLPASRSGQQEARGRNGGGSRRGGESRPDGEPRRASGETRRDGGRGRMPDRDRSRGEQPRRERDEATRAAPQHPHREPREAGRRSDRQPENRHRGQQAQPNRDHQAQPQRTRSYDPRAERPAVQGQQRPNGQDKGGRPHRNGGHHPAPVRVGAPLAERPAQRTSGPAVEAALDQVAFLRRGTPGRRDTGHSVER
ncbi:DEAD/DEAH box helicase [Rhodoplanes sp. SY1]|uniref:DEAD/DEAH box helicase n=1 Tax=Rhodoplanes sp. SY1 TaxID=3166646 RepID=UPI0038B5CD2F